MKQEGFAVRRRRYPKAYNPDHECLQKTVLERVLKGERERALQRAMGLVVIMIGILSYLALMIVDTYATTFGLKFNFLLADFWVLSNFKWFLPTILFISMGWFMRVTAFNSGLNLCNDAQRQEINEYQGSVRFLKYFLIAVVFVAVVTLIIIR